MKLLDTLIILGSVDPMLALMFLGAIGVCCIPRIGISAVVIVSIVMLKFSKANFFIIGLSAALIGAILGCLPGMAIGGIIGLSRKSALAPAKRASLEPEAVAVKAVLLPLIAGCALFIYYLFVFNPWLVTLLEIPKGLPTPRL